MKKHFVLMGIFLLLILVIFASNQEWTIQGEGEDQEYFNGREIISVGPCALKPFKQSDMVREWFTLPWIAYVSASETEILPMCAPVYLPHGATIKEFHVYFKDNDPSSHLSVGLSRKKLKVKSLNEIAYLTTQKFSPAPGIQVTKDLIIQNPVVDNKRYAYFIDVGWQRGSDMACAFHGAKIIIE
jgi:hypothetical protein